MHLRHVLDRKNATLPMVTVRRDATVKEATSLLCRHRISALLVTSAEDRGLLGIVTEWDVLKQCCLGATAIGRVSVDNIMTRNPVVGEPEAKVRNVIRRMTIKRIRHLPVVEDDLIIGIVSISDILRALIEDDDLKSRRLSDYLSGIYACKAY